MEISSLLPSSIRNSFQFSGFLNFERLELIPGYSTVEPLQGSAESVLF